MQEKMEKDGYDKALEEIDKEILKRVGNGEEMSYDIFKKFSIKIFEEYIEELYLKYGAKEGKSKKEYAEETFDDWFREMATEGELDEYDDEDGWRTRSIYIDGDNFSAEISIPTRVWDCEFFDEEDSDEVKFYKVKKIAYTAYRYEREGVDYSEFEDDDKYEEE